MKRWLIALTALALLSLVCVPLTLAAGHGKPQGKPHPGAAKAHVEFQCEATVFSATPAGGPLTVTVKSGSKTIKSSRGKQVTVQVDPKAKLVDATVDPSVPLTLDQLVRGAKVHLGGTIDRTTDPATFTATKVVLQKLPSAP